MPAAKPSCKAVWNQNSPALVRRNHSTEVSRDSCGPTAHVAKTVRTSWPDWNANGNGINDKTTECLDGITSTFRRTIVAVCISLIGNTTNWNFRLSWHVQIRELPTPEVCRRRIAAAFSPGPILERLVPVGLKNPI